MTKFRSTIIIILFVYLVTPSLSYAINASNLNNEEKALFQSYVFRVAPLLSAERLALANQLVAKGYEKSKIDESLGNAKNIIDGTIIGLGIFRFSNEAKLRNYLKKETLEATLGEIDSQLVDFVFNPNASIFLDTFIDLVNEYKSCKTETFDCYFVAGSALNHSINAVAKAINWVSYPFYTDAIYERLNAIIVADKYIQNYIEFNGYYTSVPVLSDIEQIANSLGYENSWSDTQYNEEVAINYSKGLIAVVNRHVDDYRNNEIVTTPINHKPSKPNISIQGGTSGVSERPLIIANGFYDQDGDTHLQTWWGIKSIETNGWVWDSGWRSSDLYSTRPPTSILQSGQTYKAYVAFKDEHGAWSTSDTIVFTTAGYINNSRPNTPSLTIIGGTSNTSLTPLLKASDFSDPNLNDKHHSTWWGIRDGTGNSYFWPTTGGQWFPTGSTSISVPDGILEHGKTYQAAVAYRDNNGAYSYGGFVTFTTAIQEEPYEPNNILNEATILIPSISQQHSIKPANDVDVFRFTLNESSDITLSTSGSSGDTFLLAWNEDITWVKSDDSGGSGRFSKITAQAPAGNYYAIVIEDSQDEIIPSYFIELEISATVNHPELEVISYRIDDDSSGGSNGNNNDQVNPGEIIELDIRLKNTGQGAAHNVSAMLSSSDSCIIDISDNQESWGTISSGNMDWNNSDYDFNVSSSCPNGHILYFDLDISADEGSWNRKVHIPVVNNIVNLPPNIPSLLSPSNGSSGISISTYLDFSGGDPDSGDTVTYDVYLEANDPTPDNLVCNDASFSFCDPSGDLSYSTTYYWKVIARDNHGATKSSSVWSFTTDSELNSPPNTPSNPSPSNGSSGVSISTNFDFSGGDLDSGDTVTYDVYIEANNPTPANLVCNDALSSFCDPSGDLSYSTTYYWKVIARDNHGETTSSPTWTFFTEEATHPDLVVQSLSVSDSTLTPGQSFIVSATVKNQGDSSSSNTSLRYYLSTNSIISPSETQISTVGVPALSPGYTSFASDSEIAPSTPNTYWVGACVDQVSGELNVGNNCSHGVKISVSNLQPANINITPIVSLLLQSNSKYRADVNGDGRINTTDAMLVGRFILGLDMSQTDWFHGTHTGDANCSNTVDSHDQDLILRYSLGLEMVSTDWCIK